MPNAPVDVVARLAKQRALLLSIFLAALFCSIGCTSSKPAAAHLPALKSRDTATDEARLAATAASRFEVITPEAQSLDAVTAAKTTFVVAPSQDIETWERARMFISLYTKDGIREDSMLDRGALLSNFTPGDSKESQDSYRYKIQKRYGRGGVQYLVTCSAAAKTATPQLAELNAKNAARFLSDGMLERTLLAE